jgi:hypothetical protein
MYEWKIFQGECALNAETTFDRTAEDVGNIVHFEHVNLHQPDQGLATIFYVSGLGLTRDPYMFTGIENMWINIGRHQMHLPTGDPQRIRGTIALVVPDLKALKLRLTTVAPLLQHTGFEFIDRENVVEVMCPWGNRFRCYSPAPEFGSIELGIAYVEFDVGIGTAAGIADFYREIMSAETSTGMRRGSLTASVRAGRDQYLFFRETGEPPKPYDGHHIQIYISDFSGPYQRLIERKRITRETDSHEWRFRDIVHPRTNDVLFTIEHEVRSLKHPLYARPLINRNPAQNNKNYIRGKDAFQGTF